MNNKLNYELINNTSISKFIRIFLTAYPHHEGEEYKELNIGDVDSFGEEVQENTIEVVNSCNDLIGYYSQSELIMEYLTIDWA